MTRLPGKRPESTTSQRLFGLAYRVTNKVALGLGVPELVPADVQLILRAARELEVFEKAEPDDEKTTPEKVKAALDTAGVTIDRASK